MKVKENLNLSRNIGYLILDIEKLMGYKVTNSCYDSLDLIILKMSELLSPGASPLDHIILLDCLLKEGMGYKYTKKFDIRFSEALQSREVDCDTGCAITLAIGESLKWPTKLVQVPKHTFIIWEERFSYETAVGELALWGKYKEIYQKKYKISDEAINRGTYLFPLGKYKALSHLIVDIGVNLSNKKEFKKSNLVYDFALDLDKNNINALVNKAANLFEYNQFENSLNLLKQALYLDPENWEIYRNLGELYEAMGNNKLALEHYNKSLLINPNNEEIIKKKVKIRSILK